MFPYLPIVSEPLRMPLAVASACPACGGALFELRGQQRCSRCYFIICENCEGGPVAGADRSPSEFFAP